MWQPQPAAAETIRQLSWHLDAMHVEDAQRITTGDGVTVAVVDTGVDASHPDLEGRVLDGMEIGAQESEAPSGDGRTDTDGHGTGMASLIAGKGGGPNNVLGVAPDAKILPVQIAQDAEGAFRPQDVYDGVRWAIDHGAKVVNISLGGERTTDAPWKRQLIDYAIKKDVVLIAAAGNTGDGDKRVSEPAAIPGVVAVSGVKQDGTFWEGSARGPEVVVSAPAEGLPHAVPKSVTRSGYAIADGTSGATALVSGVAALIRSAFPDSSANDVVNRLIHTVEDRGAAGRDPEYGYGVVDARAALEGDVPGAKHHPLVTPEPEKSGAAADASGAQDGVLIGLGVVGGTVVLVLVAVYLVALARRSRQVVVVAGVTPGASVQVSSDSLYRTPPPGSTGWPSASGPPHSVAPPPTYLPHGGATSPNHAMPPGVPPTHPVPPHSTPHTPHPAPSHPAPSHPAPSPSAPSQSGPSYPAPSYSPQPPSAAAPASYPAHFHAASQPQRPDAGPPSVWPTELPASVPSKRGNTAQKQTSDGASETQQLPIVAESKPTGASSTTPPADPWARPPSGR